MTKLSVEAKVGFFVVVGIMILAYMAMKAGRLEYGRDRGYEMYAYFDSAEGLVKGVPVEIAGVEVGRVKKISLEGGKAKVVLQLNPEVQIGEDAEAAIRTKGVLGDKYVEVILGSPQAAPIKPGGCIERTQSPANIDTLLKQLSSIGTDIKKITQSFSGVLGGEEGEASLKIILDNIRELAVTLNETVQRNNENINRILDNFTIFSGDLKEISGTNKEAMHEIVTNFRQASNQFREALIAFNEITEKINRGEGTIGKLIHDEETIRSMNDTLVALKEITEKINRGEGTIGKLVQDDETVDNLNDTLASINDYLQKEERFRTYVDYRGEYLFDVDDMKSYLSLRIQPKEDKYYLLQIIDDPAGKKRVTETTTTVGGVSTTEKKEEIDKDEIKFSAQIAKRYYDLGLRGGLFESTGGIGADYYLFDDRLVLSLEAFDFDPDENPHLKFKIDYTPFHYIYVTSGFDNFISNEGKESFFVGAGLHFSDEDLKTLLSGAPIPKK
ncbi:MAG: MCE family protein [Deltaproteobacteria bacterium]|nr:MAG: MCE family protein [Deltaproteobacteria bacterium]